MWVQDYPRKTTERNKETVFVKNPADFPKRNTQLFLGEKSKMSHLLVDNTVFPVLIFQTL